MRRKCRAFSRSGWEYGFQIATCPTESPPGFRLVELVPIWFAHDPVAIGTPITEEDIRPVMVESRAGWRATVLETSVDITRADGDDLIWIEVRDSAQNALHASLNTPGSLTELLTPHDEVIDMQTGGGSVDLQIVRRVAGQGGADSTLYAPISLRIDSPELSTLVDAWDHLEYESTDRNRSDRLVADAGDQQVSWHVEWDEILRHFVRIDGDTHVVLEDVELFER